jgi:hypothetical protein
VDSEAFMEAIGIGCIWFAVNPATYDEENFSPSEHMDEIKRALESVDNVSNVDFTGETNTLSGYYLFDDDEEEDETFFPIYSRVLLEFDIFVPHRLQEKYGNNRWTTPNVETFHVKLLYDRMPVACIHYSVRGTEADAREFSPANAVVFIRRYLEEKLLNHPKVKFESLGPSPFHADIFLEPARGEVASGTAKDLTEPGDGYRTFHIITKAGKPDEAVLEFLDNNHGILVAYYLAVRTRNHTRKLASKLTGGARKLLLPNKTKPWTRFLYWYRLRHEIDAVYGALLDEKMHRVNLAAIDANIKEDEQIPLDSVFYTMIEREMRGPDELPHEDIRELLIMLEERRRGYFQNVATLVSGLAGGLLGAVLGAALTYALTSPAVSKAAQTTPVPFAQLAGPPGD